MARGGRLVHLRQHAKPKLLGLTMIALETIFFVCSLVILFDGNARSC